MPALLSAGCPSTACARVSAQGLCKRFDAGTSAVCLPAENSLICAQVEVHSGVLRAMGEQGMRGPRRA